MKTLVYGAGVIGSYLTHVLCAAGNDVTLLARGDWRETLERDGLTIVHHLQKKTTHDRPHIIVALDRTHYDLVFAVMQYQQMSAILGDLALADSPLDALGYPILPEDTMEKLHGPQGGLSYVMLRLIRSHRL